MKNKLKELQRYNIILASQSPRRHMLMDGLGLNFSIKVKNVNEVFPDDMHYSEVPIFLSQLKAKAFCESHIPKNTIVITADTVVVHNNKIIGKPKDREEAISIIKSLSGNQHIVITGVSITSNEKQISFSSESKVFFKDLMQEDIEYYVEKYRPYDKAGAYGIQEWIGYIGIEKIEGSFYNVMGFPTQLVYEHLIKFI